MCLPTSHITQRPNTDDNSVNVISLASDFHIFLSCLKASNFSLLLFTRLEIVAYF